MGETAKDRMTIIFFSGTMDKAMAMLILASTAASMGMDVSVFFTFWGLNFLKKGKKYRQKNLLQKMLEFMTPASKETLPLSSLNMAGMGPWMMKKLMTSKKTASIDELFAIAKEFNVKLYACSTSCGIMGIDRDNMIEGVTDIVGAASFLREAQQAKINLFI
jgi:peroxiredoxin family protein